jgi:endonuclease/exonuclease/phosphatase (EEP) superfamily protein YafD
MLYDHIPDTDPTCGEPFAGPGDATEAWESYRGGISGVVAVVTGRAARGDGPHTLAAALTGHLLAAGALAVAGVALVGSAPAAVAGALVLAAICIVQARTWVALRPAPRLRGDGVRIAGWNILNHNTAAAVQTGVQACEADILILFEVESRHLAAAQASGDGRRWTGQARDGSLLHDGIACGIASACAVHDVCIVDIDGMAAVRVELDVAGSRLAVWGYRPAAPTTSERRAAWASQLRTLGDTLATEPLPYVVLGDLNSTVWHTPFQQLVRALRWRRGSRTLGGTWQHHRIGWRARIDHIYAGPGVASRDAWRGAAHGSDHRPIGCTVGVEAR